MPKQSEHESWGQSSNQVRGTSRVTYDSSSKPPATIESE
ncbi:MAG: hypothetical protein KUG82_12270 [Pseudomonadales bacterium]|nr:hypothetical protein [Pseudomonadales bacterium]